MKKKQPKATALPTERDNKTELALAWLAYNCKFASARTYQAFEFALNKTLKRILPDNAMSGVLRGLEDQIRQGALIELMLDYLQGNPDLRSATAQGSLKKIKRILVQSVNRAVKYSKREVLRHEKAVASRHQLTDDVDQFARETIVHPAQIRNYWELPPDIQLQIVKAGVRQAMHEKRLPQNTAGMIAAMIEHGWSASETSRRLGVSPQTVHNRLKRSGDYFREFIDHTEFPM